MLLNYANPLNRQHPLAWGLQHWWLVLPGRFGGTTWRDLARTNHGVHANMALPATLTSGRSLGTTRPGGWGELRFDGTNDRLRGFPMAPPASGTITLWFKSLGNTATNGYLFSHFTDGPGDRIYLLIDATDDKLYARLDGNGATAISPGAVAGDGLWHFVALVYGLATQVGQSKAYVDMLPPVTVTNATQFLVTSAINLTLGANVSATETNISLFFQGALDDVKVYDRVLSPLEVQALRQESLLGQPTLLHWGQELAQDWWHGMSAGVGSPWHYYAQQRRRAV
jgi:hypothetical protein